MKQYGNWIPKRMVYLDLVGLLCFYGVNIWLIFQRFINISIVFTIISILWTLLTIKLINLYKVFDYNNEDSLSWKIINFVSSFVKVEPNQKILDIGCGSGALSILCAKRNPASSVLGVDRWGIEYNNFSKKVCEDNAFEENVKNVSFIKGDAKNLNFEKESFDCITSNYVIHNIPGDRQELLLSIFDLLKKGGTFAIHDLFTKEKYGNTESFINKLKALGFEKVELIDTTQGNPMTRKEAKKSMLKGSKLLYGKK